jgi:hypothetical protein
MNITQQLKRALELHQAGKSAWAVMSKLIGFFCMDDRDNNPWYPGLKLFRQPEMGDWQGAFNRALAELKAFAKKRA